MKNEELIKNITSRIIITDFAFHENDSNRIGEMSVCFTLNFDPTHESCKWFKEKIEDGADIRYALADNLIMRVVEPVDGYMEQIMEDEARNCGFYAVVKVLDWNDTMCRLTLETQFPL